MTSSDDDLWRKFSQTVKPLTPKDRHTIPFVTKKSQIYQRSDLISQSALFSEPQLLGKLCAISVEKFHKNLKKSSIDATLDLHGELIKNAHLILMRFVERAVQLDHRIILIVTGKSLGKASTDAPRLVKMVPFWLKNFPLNQYVKKVNYAKQNHGGNGAFYVFLRPFKLNQ